MTNVKECSPVVYQVWTGEQQPAQDVVRSSGNVTLSGLRPRRSCREFSTIAVIIGAFSILPLVIASVATYRVTNELLSNLTDARVWDQLIVVATQSDVLRLVVQGDCSRKAQRDDQPVVFAAAAPDFA